MNAAFILHLDVGSDTDFLSIAEDIMDAAEAAGLAPIECKPWAREATQTLPSTMSLGTPPPISPAG